VSSSSSGREPAIVVDGVSKRFRMYRERNQSLKAAIMRGRRASFEEFWALKDVSLTIPKGSTFGLIGENGSGKSTLLKCIARILVPNRGRIATTGSLAALLELGSGFHPELSGRDNVYLNASILGMSKSQIADKFDEIVDFAGIHEFIDQPVKNYSSGMYVRLGFSVAINVDPDILLVDEVLAVGDANFQEKCMEKFADLRHSGKTVVIVSHAMGSLRNLCDEAAWLQHGELIEVGDTNDLVENYIETGHVKRVIDTGSGPVMSDRSGSGEVVLTAVELLDAKHTPTSTVHSADEVVVRMRYDAKERVERPLFALSLDTLAGVHVWTHNSRDGDCTPDSIKGEGWVEIRIPRLSLQAGTFDLHASVNDYLWAHPYDRWRFALRFDVLDRPGHDGGGIVDLGGTWTLSTDHDDQDDGPVRPGRTTSGSAS
jgi:ABC-type polysaccharide/polyol phosphate transport system ATPase subunit